MRGWRPYYDFTNRQTHWRFADASGTPCGLAVTTLQAASDPEGSLRFPICETCRLVHWEALQHARQQRDSHA